jgi:hypothetical protein
MADWVQFKTNWLRPFLFFGNNWISLIGGALTTASALVLTGFWVVAFFGHSGSSNPYLGIVFDLILPGLFLLGLMIIPIGVLRRRSLLRAAGSLPTIYPEVDFQDPVFRRGIDFVAIATFVNFVIVGAATYRGVAYMDTPNFCGQACHVMTPEWSAYPVSSHADVACTACHIAAGIPGFLYAKVNGTKQLLMIMAKDYPRPIMADNKIPPARTTCLNCHNGDANFGDRLQVETSYGDDENNSVTKTVVLLHVGGSDQFGHRSGIHGAHLSHIEYAATDSTNQTIPWIRKIGANGSIVEYRSSDSHGSANGPWRTMDCIDCHNRAAHSFDTPEKALNEEMTEGVPSSSLPFVHREGLALLKASYTSRLDAAEKIRAGIRRFYQSRYPAVWNARRPQIDRAATALVAIYDRNVFPFMKVTWGTHPNNIGHNAFPGCSRCHDGSHSAKNGKSIPNDCSVCHNLVAVEDPNPKQLTALGIQ